MNLLTERVLGAVFEVSNTLGAGFLEKVDLGQVVPQASFSVLYKGVCVEEYFADSSSKTYCPWN